MKDKQDPKGIVQNVSPIENLSSLKTIFKSLVPCYTREELTDLEFTAFAYERQRKDEHDGQDEY